MHKHRYADCDVDDEIAQIIAELRVDTQMIGTPCDAFTYSVDRIDVEDIED